MSALGFLNRLAEKTASTAFQRRVGEIIRAHLGDDDAAESFFLSFSAAVLPLHPGARPETALANAYTILSRAKVSPTRLLIVFEEVYERPQDRRDALEDRLERLRARDGGAAETRDLERDAATLRKAEQLVTRTTAVGALAAAQ